MSPEKDILLRQRYPKIFKASEHNDEPHEMWGFECHDGWFELIDTLCAKIQSHIDWRSKNIQDIKQLEDLQASLGDNLANDDTEDPRFIGPGTASTLYKDALSYAQGCQFSTGEGSGSTW
jgi:hypothetical protein